MSNKELICVGYGSYATDPAWQVVIYHAPEIYAVIGNPGSGVGKALDTDWLAVFTKLKAAGVKILGYISTRYGARPIAEVRREVIQWRDWYNPDGIFLDETAQSAGGGALEHYRGVIAVCRSQIPKAIVVCNFGTVPDKALFDLADISCIAETDQETYIVKPFPSWVFQVPSKRIYNIIYAVNDPAKVRNRIAQNNAGFWTMVTTVKKPGADGPEFDIKDIIWPTDAAPAPTPTPTPEDPNWASLTIQQGLRALGASPDATAKDLVPLITAMKLENTNLKAGVKGFTNAQIIADVARRLALIT